MQLIPSASARSKLNEDKFFAPILHVDELPPLGEVQFEEMFCFLSFIPQAVKIFCVPGAKILKVIEAEKEKKSSSAGGSKSGADYSHLSERK